MSRLRTFLNWYFPRQTYCFWCSRHIEGRLLIVLDDIAHRLGWRRP